MRSFDQVMMRVDPGDRGDHGMYVLYSEAMEEISRLEKEISLLEVQLHIRQAPPPPPIEPIKPVSLEDCGADLSKELETQYAIRSEIQLIGLLIKSVKNPDRKRNLELTLTALTNELDNPLPMTYQAKNKPGLDSKRKH